MIEHPPIRPGLIFGYPEVLAYMGGDVMKLEELPTFKKAWNHQGGLLAFQQHVQSKLADI
jgi:hypothetical protein